MSVMTTVLVCRSDGPILDGTFRRIGIGKVFADVRRDCRLSYELRFESEVMVHKVTQNFGLRSLAHVLRI